MKRNLVRGLSGIAALILAIGVCATVICNRYEGSVNAALGIQTGSVAGADAEYVYKTDYTSDGRPSDDGMRALIADEDAFNETAMEESAVLLYNNGALPFGSETKNVTLLGRAVVDPVYRCTSAGPTIDENRVIGLADAMEDAGFSLNQTLLDAYSNSSTARVSGSTQDIGEESISFYTNELTSTFSGYGDAAIIMFSRLAGEGIDAAKTDADGVNQLSLHDDEADLLRLVKSYKDSGTFKKVIVLINSAYAMELDWLYDPQYGVDAALWIGNPGLTGFTGIPDILTGDANPSGHLVDTYATDSLSSPAAQNDGNNAFADNYRTYAVYAEGIYVGYKYYETRYEDLILGVNEADSTAGTFASDGAWDYADEVLYPFGYGMSYSTFSQTLDSVTWNDDGTITAEVTVTNTSGPAGKDVVQLYAQTPYGDYEKGALVEKSAVQLLDFAKTDIIAPGESETVTITADKYLIASWDGTAHEGEGGYILSEGDYYIAIGDDAHDALNNILAAKGATGMYDEFGGSATGNAENAALHTLDALDDETYRYSEETGEAVDNKFDKELFASDYNYYYDGAITYLTRQDWTTFPKNYSDLAISDRMIEIHSGDYYDELQALLGEPEQYTLSTPADTLFIEMKDVGWDEDEKWTEFLSQLSVNELAIIVDDSWGQAAITKISKPANYQCDGPDGGSTKYKYGDKGNNTTYVGQGTMACSWSKEIMERRGYFLAEDAFYNNTSCTMAPGVNIHRTPFSGRNHEYYSEDGVLSYIMGGVQCAEMQRKGTVAMLKHLCANDQEANRRGLCEFMTEQTLRESSLRGFEGCIRVGSAGSAMTAFNCIGVTKVSSNYALLTEVVRGEWGWTGFFDTDANDGVSTPELCVLSGIDEFCLTTNIYKEIASSINAGDDKLLGALMETNKRFYYTYLRSNLINGLTVSSTVADSQPWWRVTLVTIDAVFAVIAAAGAALYLFMYFTKRDSLGKRREG